MITENPISRRDFLKLSGLGLGAIPLAACGEAWAATEKASPQTLTDILNFYRNQGLLLQPTIKLPTPVKDLTFFNFSTLVFNEDIAYGTYTFFENLNLSRISYTLLDENLVLEPTRAKWHSNTGAIIVTPEEITLPPQFYAMHVQIEELSAFTSIPLPEDNSFITVIRVPHSDNPETDSSINNLVIMTATEACQSSIFANPELPALIPGSKRNLFSTLTQEALCVSLGYAAGARSAGTPYEEFREREMFGTLSIPVGEEIIEVPKIPIDESLYNSLPAESYLMYK